jgi:predicted CxxxxCH...CXXCH cytochrome family protein
MPMRRAQIPTWLAVVAAAVLFALLACGCSGDEGVPEDPGTADGGPADDAAIFDGAASPGIRPQGLPAKGAGFTCEVKKLLTVKCQTCHSDPPVGGALVPLVTVKHMVAWSKTEPSKTVAQVALERMQLIDAPMPPVSFNNAATADEIQAFEAWTQANFVGFCQGAVPPNATCTTCHGDSTRVGGPGTDPQITVAPPRGTNGETLTTQAAVGAHQAHLGKTSLASAPLQCADCHVLPTSMSHSDGIIDMSWGPFAKAGGANPNYNGSTCTNVYCHGAFPGGRTVFAPSWTGGPMTCGSCHGTPPPTPPHTNPAAECSTCHGAGYSQTAKTVDKAKHINGVVDVNFTAATCTSCHGDTARAAIAGADPQVKASPPVGSKGETAATTRAVGAHAAHVNKATWSANPLQCADCHVVPTSTGHSNGVVDIAFGALAKTAGAAPAWNGATCANVYCHGAFAGGTPAAAPSWATPGGVACGSCHALPPATTPHANKTLECSTCHGAGYSQTAKTVNKALHINGVVDTTGQTCTSCHGDAARVASAGADPGLKFSPPLGSKGETLASTRAVGAHQAHVNKGTFSTPMACNECHLVPISTSHSNGKVDIAWGALAKKGGVTPAWNGTTCSASYCHGNFTGGNTAAAPAWTTSGTLACNSCHALPPATAAHSNPALACSTCHGPGYSASAQTVDKTLHINGVVDVDNGALSCTSCHGDDARAGIAGSDPGLKFSPPLGTKGETLISTRAVGRHQEHLNAGTFSAPTACAECHVVPITNGHSNGKVDMLFGALARTGGATPAWSGTTCTSSYCHGKFSGGNAAAAPAWTSGTVDCTSCHANPPATPPHANTALACSLCHGTGYSTTAVNKTTHLNGVVNVDQGALTCTSCHGSNARVGVAGSDAKQASAPPVGVHGETAKTAIVVGAHQAHLNQTTLTANPIQCNACHAVPSSNLHSDGVIQVTFGALAKTGGVSPTFNGTGCASTYCHGSFPNGGNAVPSWTGGPLSCTSCHGTPPPTSEHQRGKHQVPCGNCHGAGYTSTVLVKNLHINGVNDVAGPNIKTWNAGTKSCTPTCHGNERWK